MSKSYKPSNNATKILDLVIADYLLRTVELDYMIPTFNHRQSIHDLNDQMNIKIVGQPYLRRVSLL